MLAMGHFQTSYQALMPEVSMRVMESKLYAKLIDN
jgi:hypothetical protein